MSTDHAADELLETETGQQLAQSPPVLPVEVTNRVIVEEVTPQDEVLSTFVISTTTNTNYGTGIAELLPDDPLRVSAVIVTWDEPVVICHSRAQANDANNQAANVPFPQGGYLGTGTGLTVRTKKRLWVAATSSTNTRVTLVVSRRRP